MSLVNAGALVFWASCVVVACGSHDADVERMGGEPLPDGGVGGGDDASVELYAWCDVERILRVKCQQCHGDPPQVGPFPLVEYEDTQRAYPEGGMRFVWQIMGPAVESEFMPLMSASLDIPVESLTEMEKEIVVGWSEQGGQPVGGTDCDDSSSGGSGGGGSGGASAEGGTAGGSG